MPNSYNEALACKFLEKFARFECGMKEAGFCKARNKKGVAGLEWERFRDELGGGLEEQHAQGLSAAIAYLLEHPPEVQFIEELKLAGGIQRRSVFRPYPLNEGASRGARALEAVYRVRNNLFHGGKHTNHSPEERDDQLMHHSITVLDAASMLDPVLSRIYWR